MLIPPPTSAGAFEDQASDVLGRMRESFRGIVRSLPEPTDGATQLQRALELDMKLCWKVTRMLAAPSPLAAAMHVPGPANTTAFLTRARQAGAPADLIDAASRAAGDFDVLVREHAGDRRTFDSMVSAWADDASDRITLNCRRDAFRANSHIWGLQADAQMACYIWGPSATNAESLDGAGYATWVGLRRLRRTPAPLLTQLTGITDDDDQVRRSVHFEPVDPGAADEHGVAIIGDFCTADLPRLRTRRLDGGYVSATMPLEMIGNRAAVDLTVGTIVRGFGQRRRDEHNRLGIHSAIVQTPVRVLLLDLLIHDDAFHGSVAPRSVVYADRSCRGTAPLDAENVLWQDDPITYLGRGASVLESSDVPRCPDMARHVFNRLGADPAAYQAHRYRLEYPVMLSRAAMQIDLPE